MAALLKPVMGNAALVNLSVLGMLALTVLCAMLSGNSGVMHCAQLQLGMAYLGLFGSTALLLYLHVSALTPLPPHGTLAVVFVAAWCAVILWYRRSKYVDTNLIRIANLDRQWHRAGAQRSASLPQEVSADPQSMHFGIRRPGRSSLRAWNFTSRASRRRAREHRRPADRDERANRRADRAGPAAAVLSDRRRRQLAKNGRDRKGHRSGKV